MSKKINLEDIANKFAIIDGYSLHSNPQLAKESFIKFCKAFAKEILELANENAKLVPYTDNCGDPATYLDKQSILDTIKQIE